MCQHSSHVPDHLLLLVQQVRSHYTEPPPQSKPGRPRTYTGLSFLLLAVVAVTLRTCKGLELRRRLAKDARLRHELGCASVPHRRTIERRLSSLQPEGRGSGRRARAGVIEQAEPQGGLPVAASIDGRRYEALGPRWHQKQRKAGIIPRGLRNLGEESAWSKSGYRGRVQGYRLVMQCWVWPAPIPPFATWQPNNRGEGKVFAAALEQEQVAVAPVLLGDESFGTPALAAAYARRGGWLLTPQQLPKRYQTFKHEVYAWRQQTIELLFPRVPQAFDLRRCPTKSLRRNGAFVIASVWAYQVICWSNYQQGKPMAQVKERIDLARWRIAA